MERHWSGIQPPGCKQAVRKNDHTGMADSGSGGAEAVDEVIEARLLCSFAPALMLKEMEKSGKAIHPPMTHQYEGIALFAVRWPWTAHDTSLPRATT
jgi:hypothetical protein